MNDVTIVAPVYLGTPHRLQYFETYIKSCLTQCNFEKINFVFMVEPDVMNFDLLTKLRLYPNIRIMVNPYRYKLLLNQYMTLYYSFEILGLEHVIYTEDDCVMSNDMYDITKFYVNSQYYDNNTILTYLNKDNLIDPPQNDDGKDILEIKQNFHPVKTGMVYFATWGYLCTRRMWFDCLQKWPHQWCFSEHLLPHYLDKIKTVTPRLSRLNHIGVLGASYNEEIYNSHEFTKYMPPTFSDRIDYKFYEI